MLCKTTLRVLILGLVVLLAWFLPRGFAWLHEGTVAPKLACPSLIDMGAAEMATTCRARLTIANEGGGELVIDKIRTNCGCTGLERERDGKFETVESLRLAPGTEAAVVIRASVGGKPGGLMRNLVSFHTTDPSQPEFTIEAIVSKITGGVIGDPSSVVFAAVEMGSLHVAVVQVLDTAEVSRQVERIECSHPERFTARLIPAQAVQDRGAEQSRVPIAAIEVCARTEKSGPLDGEILLYLKGEHRAPDAIAVAGRVYDIVEVAPSSLVLPRRHGQDMTYAARCIWSSPAEGELELEILSVPAQLTVALTGSGSQKMLEVCLADRNPVVAADLEVRVRARVAGRQTIISIPVKVIGGRHDLP